jgi:hypothetical protein
VGWRAWAHETQYERLLEQRRPDESPAASCCTTARPTHRRHPLRHLLNKVLKDIVVRSQLLMGAARASCRLGLPRPAHRAAGREAGRLKDKLGVEEFRSAARRTR